MPAFEPRHHLTPGATGASFVHVVGTSVWVAPVPANEEWPVHVVGLLDGACCYAVDVPAGDDPSDGAAVDLYAYHGRAGEDAWLAAGRAVQLVEWARTHRFCGRCGGPTEPVTHERAMRCPACGLSAFPRLAPAMITLVTRGQQGPDEEALLARGVRWTVPMYSCLAGFVEPGESLEASVAREVMEEVGLSVTDVRYRGSQPWPFPHSLMIGFRARYRSGALTLDPAEIVDAGWFRRDQLPLIPPPISIARRLIDEWLDEVPEVSEGTSTKRPSP
jgi:NAD+ diphosphatase